MSASLCRVNSVWNSFCRNSQQTARIAAPWMMMSCRSTAGALQAEQVARQDEMPGAGNRQEFGDAFDQAEDDRVDDGHASFFWCEARECSQLRRPAPSAHAA